MLIEIGTSDFRTEAGNVDGLFIEPVKEHFDRLPPCRKENVAISNREGLIEIFYIPTETIHKELLPNWVRGCNSVGSIHPTILKNGWAKFVTVDVVKVVRIKSLIDKYDIKHIDTLKIDTEGHDCVILNDFLDTVPIRPKTIQFENNVLSRSVDVENTVKRLEEIGYICKQVKFDMVCVLGSLS